MAQTVKVSNGVDLPIDDSIATTITYTTGNVTAFSRSYQGIVYVQTFTYSGSNVVGISEWVPQS